MLIVEVKIWLGVLKINVIFFDIIVLKCLHIAYWILHIAFLQGLVKAGYVRGSTLLGAPYDFRKAANEQGELIIH